MIRGRAGRPRPREEAKPAELGLPGTGDLVGLRETPAGLSAAMRERYPDTGPHSVVGPWCRWRRLDSEVYGTWQ